MGCLNDCILLVEFVYLDFLQAYLCEAVEAIWSLIVLVVGARRVPFSPHLLTLLVFTKHQYDLQAHQSKFLGKTISWRVDSVLLAYNEHEWTAPRALLVGPLSGLQLILMRDRAVGSDTALSFA